MKHKNEITIVIMVLMLAFVIILKTEIVISQTTISPEINATLAQTSNVGFGGAIKTSHQSIDSQSTINITSKDIENQIVGEHNSSNLNKTVRYEPEILEKFNKTNKTLVRVIIYYESNVEKVQFDDIVSQKNYVRNLTHSLFDYIPSTKMKNIRTGLSNSFVAEITEEGFNELIKNEKVSEIYLDVIGHVALDDSAPIINADDVWSLGYDGYGKKICIIDSGVNAAHSDLSGKIQDEYCYCDITDLGSGGCCPDNTDEDNDAEDDYGHGTHVAGILASQDSTYKGIAYGASIYVVKVIDLNGNFYFSDLGNAIDRCRLWNVDVISLSLSDGGNHPGSSSCPTDIDTKINNAYNKNISIIAASGNKGYTTGISYPACSSNVISVGASTKSDNLASFTNRGSNLDLLAPGQSITSLRWDSSELLAGCSGLGNDFMICSGTSYSTPHVSGAAALLLEKDSSLTPDEIRETLQNTGTSVSGYPRINVLAAINSIGAEGEEGQLSDCEESGYDQCIEYEYGDCDVSIAVNHYTNVNDIRWGAVNDDSDPYVIGEYTIGWKAVDADQMYYDVNDPNGGDCYEGGCDGDEVADEDTKITVYAPGTASRETVLGYDETASYYCWVFFNDFNPGYGENDPIYALECYYDSDCSASQYCDKSGNWDDWECVSEKSDGQSCTTDNQCSSGYCDNDAVGLSDDNHCFTPYNSYFDGQETSYCEYSAGNGIVDCDERQSGDDLNQCIGTSYYEEECSSTCNYQDVTSVFECTDTGCSCSESLCDGQTTGSNIATCASGQTYLADKCTSTAGGEDRTDNICRSSAFASGCTADVDCNGVTTGTQGCSANCIYSASGTDLNITSLSEIYTNNTLKIFEFGIKNNGTTGLNVTWSFNPGDGSDIIYSNYSSSLNSNETVFVYVEYNYSSSNQVNVIVTAMSGALNASMNISVGFNISNLKIEGFTQLDNESLTALFEINITNNGTTNMSNINWSFDAGDGSSIIYADTLLNLSSGENAFIYVQHTYASSAQVTANASAFTDSEIDSKELNVSFTVSDINLKDFKMIYRGPKQRIFEFIINNTLATQLTNITWSLDTGVENITSSSAITLNGSESIFVQVEYNYSDIGDYTATAAATNATTQDSETVNVKIKEISVSNLRDLMKSTNQRLFEFIVTNNLDTNLSNAMWNISFGDGTAAESTTPLTLGPNEQAFIYVQTNYSAGSYTVNATAWNTTTTDSDTLDVII